MFDSIISTVYKDPTFRSSLVIAGSILFSDEKENRRVSSRFKSLSFEYKLSSSTSDFRYKSILLPTVYVRLNILTTIRTEGYKSHSLLPYLLPRYPDRRTGLDFTLQTDYNHAVSSLQRGSLRKAQFCRGGGRSRCELKSVTAATIHMP